MASSSENSSLYYYYNREAHCCVLIFLALALKRANKSAPFVSEQNGRLVAASARNLNVFVCILMRPTEGHLHTKTSCCLSVFLLAAVDLNLCVCVCVAASSLFVLFCAVVAVVVGHHSWRLWVMFVCSFVCVHFMQIRRTIKTFGQTFHAALKNSTTAAAATTSLRCQWGKQNPSLSPAKERNTMNGHHCVCSG